MGNSLGSSNSTDVNFRTLGNNSRLSTSRESVSRSSFASRDSASGQQTGIMVPRRQRRRLPQRRNEAVLLSLSRLIVEAGRHADWVDVNDSWDEQKVKSLVEALLLAPRQQGLDEPFGEYQEECPICFYFYSRVNRSSCCNKPICTNCFVYIQRKIRKKCPYCNKWGLEVYLPKQSCSDTEKHGAQKWSTQDKENVNLECRSCSMSTRNCCDEVECVDSLDERKKLEECSEISVDSSGKLTTNSLRKTTESCLASERMALKEMKQGEDWTESFEDGKDFDCCNLIDTSESVVADNDCDVSQEEECYDRNESETFAFESTSNPHLETPSWVVEKPTNRSNDWLSRKKKMCRSIDENLLDTLAFTCGSVVSPIASSLEHSGRCNETSESSPGEVADNDSLFHIEEDNDMFVQLFKLDSSYDSSDVVRVDNLIHLSSDEEKVI